MKKHFLFFICMGLFLSLSFSQNTISGNVSDQFGTPMVGATVIIENTNIGTATDDNGNYTIEIPGTLETGKSYTIIVSYTGYGASSRQVELSEGNTALDFTIRENALALTEVTVTATKAGATDVMKTGMAITPFSGKLLESTGANSMQDFIQNVPGLTTLTNGEAWNIFQIRGIASPVGPSTVGYYYDETPFSFPDFGLLPELNPFDLERVEVLRGPQGTLYGASSSAGVVKIMTKNPDPTRFSAKTDLMYGTVDGGGNSYKAMGALNIPIIKDQLAVRLTGGHQVLGGFIDNSVLGLEDINENVSTSFRAKLLYRPSDIVSIQGHYWTRDFDIGAINLTTPEFDQPTPFEQKYEGDFLMYGGTIKLNFSKLDLISTTSYINLSYDTFDAANGFTGVESIGENTSFNQEIRLNSKNEGPFNWLAGVYYNDGESPQVLNLAFPLPDGTVFELPFWDQFVTSKQFAVFGELYYRFWGDKAQATVGLRYFNDDRSHEDFEPNLVATLMALGLESKRSKTYNTISPRFNLSLYPNDNTLLYATVANGFRSGIIQPGGSVSTGAALGLNVLDFVEEEDLWSFELGTKIELAQKKLALEGALYYNDWSNMMVLVQDFVDVGGQPTVVSFNDNVDGAKAFGLDWNVVYTSEKGFSLSFGGNVNESQFKSDLPGILDIEEGDRINSVPKLTLASSASHRFPIGEKLNGLVYGNLQYSSEKEDIASGRVIYVGDKITTVNARIGVEAKNWGLFLFANNLTNENGSLQRSALSPLDSRIRPRTIGINLKLNY